jgi:hypothetical protein
MPRPVVAPIRAQIAWIAASSGKAKTIAHDSEKPNWAPTWL